jgi:hypothetical protein
MRRSIMHRLLVCLPVAVVVVGLGAGLAPAGAQALVSVGSPTDQHPRNAQNEPALAVDVSRPDILAAGANDLVDMQPCSQRAATTAAACSFPLGTFNLGVGLGGVYFSFDRGHTWTQPTYTGLTAADCSPTAEPCTPHVGPIHTVPNYFEAGLRSRSDPGVAFGPMPVDGKFSWANGSRLYYSNLATNLTDTRIGPPVNTDTEVAVSHIDNVTPERIRVQANWSRPFFVAARTAATAFLDKEQIWADNAQAMWYSPRRGRSAIARRPSATTTSSAPPPTEPVSARQGEDVRPSPCLGYLPAREVATGGLDTGVLKVRLSASCRPGLVRAVAGSGRAGEPASVRVLGRVFGWVCRSEDLIAAIGQTALAPRT